METNNTMGGRIRELRTKKKMSQEKLAFCLYVKRSLICRYEKDTYDIPASKLIALAKILDTTPDYLLLGVRSKNEWADRMSGLLDEIENEEVKKIIYVQVRAVIEAGYSVSVS